MEVAILPRARRERQPRRPPAAVARLLPMRGTGTRGLHEGRGPRWEPVQQSRLLGPARLERSASAWRREHRRRRGARVHAEAGVHDDRRRQRLLGVGATQPSVWVGAPDPLSERQRTRRQPAQTSSREVEEIAGCGDQRGR